jgi:hypothetical protein
MAVRSRTADVTVRRAYGCARCESRWDGLRTAHCSACHETFTTPGVFDKHRRDGNCLPPQEAGLVLTRRAYPCWTTPSRPGMVWQSRSERLLVPPKGNDPSQRVRATLPRLRDPPAYVPASPERSPMTDTPTQAEAKKLLRSTER